MAEPIQIIITQGSQGSLDNNIKLGNILGSLPSTKDPRGTGFNPEDQLKALNRQLFMQNTETLLKGVGGALIIAKYAGSIIKDAVTTGSSLYANLTGHYIQQTRIQETLSIFDKSTSVFKTTASGALAGAGAGMALKSLGLAAGAGIGASAGFIVAESKLAIDVTSTLASWGIRAINTDMQASLLRAQSGNGNWSRGTNE